MHKQLVAVAVIVALCTVRDSVYKRFRPKYPYTRRRRRDMPEKVFCYCSQHIYSQSYLTFRNIPNLCRSFCCKTCACNTHSVSMSPSFALCACVNMAFICCVLTWWWWCRCHFAVSPKWISEDISHFWRDPKQYRAKQYIMQIEREYGERERDILKVNKISMPSTEYVQMEKLCCIYRDILSCIWVTYPTFVLRSLIALLLLPLDAHIICLVSFFESDSCGWCATVRRDNLS